MISSMEKDEFDKILYEKAKDIKTSDYSKEQIKLIMKKGKQKRIVKLCVKYAAIFLVIILSCTALYLSTNKVFNNNTYKHVITGNENEDNSTKNVVDRVFLDNTTYLKYYINYEGIYIVRVDEIVEESFKYCNPYVIVKATVLNTLSGNEIDNIELKINEVIVSIEDYEKETGDYDKYSNYSSEDKDSSYVIVTNDSNLVNASYPEVGKKYIASIYCNKGKYLVDNSAKYNFYEVNEEENQVYIDSKWKSIEL